MPDSNLQIFIGVKDEASGAFKKVKVNLGEVAQEVAKPQGMLGKLGETFDKLGMKALGVGAIKNTFEGIAGTIGGIIGPASDLSESMNKVEVVFGDSADSVKDFAAQAAQGLGQSKGAALEAAGTFGNLFGALGLSQSASADLSKQIIGLGSDLASFNNLSPDEVLEKLRSGLVGEAEPLRSLGININEATVKAKAMELGLADASGELSESAKVQARYALILEQTKVAQGDFARTSTGMANASRIIEASLNDLKTEIGSALLPTVAPLISNFAQVLPAALQATHRAVETVTSFIQGTLMPAFTNVVGIVQGRIGPVLAGMAAAIGAVVVPAFVAWAASAVTSATATIVALAPVLVPIAAIGVAVGLLKAAWDSDWGGIQEKTAAVWAVIQPIFQAIVDAIARFWIEIEPEFTKTWDAISNKVEETIGFISRVIGDTVTAIKRAWDEDWGGIKEILQIAWNDMKALIEVAFELITGAIKVALDLLRGDWSGAWDDVKETLRSVWDTIAGLVRDNLDLVQGLLDRAWGAIRGAAASAWEGIRDAIVDAVRGILSPIQGVVNQAQGIISGITGAISGIISKANDAKNAAAQAAQAAANIPSGGGGGSSGGGGSTWYQGKSYSTIEAFTAAGGNPATYGRAMGGPVMAGQSYVVGENGIELFTPGVSGSITPNSALMTAGYGGRSSSPTNLTVVVEMDRRELARTTASLQQDEQNRIVRVALV